MNNISEKESENNIISRFAANDRFALNNKIDILSLDGHEIKMIITEKLKLPSYRSKQIFTWLYRNINSFFQMTDIPQKQREQLDEIFCINGIKEIKKQVSKLDGTIKYLFELHDGYTIESVLMRYKHGNSVCISTQAGCKMNCIFCASALGGYKRNLLPSEMLLQVMYIDNFLKSENGRVSNIVLMGIGEPLDNFDNTVKFLSLVNNKDGLNIGYRHISLSTSGLVDKIDTLADLHIPLTLSVSIHASNDATRDFLMPVNRKWNIGALLNSCRRYADKTGRRISFEYIMINGVNDTDGHAYELAEKLKGMLCHVNLIPLNDILEKNLKPSSMNRVNCFSEILNTCKINATIRRKCGGDIEASCGQLRMNHQR